MFSTIIFTHFSQYVHIGVREASGHYILKSDEKREAKIGAKKE